MSFANNCFWVVISLVWKDFLEITLFLFVATWLLPSIDEIVPTVIRKNHNYFHNKFFSIYNYLFRFFFLYSVFNEQFWNSFEFLVGPSGLEPPTSCLSGTRSNLLSYEPMWLVSDLGHLNSVVTFTKWRFHFGLPKFHSLCEFHFDEVKISLRNCVSLVEMMGFEPMTPCLQGRCSPSWATPPF